MLLVQENFEADPQRVHRRVDPHGVQPRVRLRHSPPLSRKRDSPIMRDGVPASYEPVVREGGGRA
eukprot:1462885-Pyramimonas_sp.AAC.1